MLPSPSAASATAEWEFVQKTHWLKRETTAAKVSVTIKRGSKTVKRFAARDRAAGKTYRLKLNVKGLRRGSYKVSIRIVASGKTTSATLTSALI